MPEVSSHWPNLLDPALREAFFLGFSDNGRRASLLPELYGVRTSEQAWEKSQGVGVLGSDGWLFQGRLGYDESNAGWLKTFTHAEFARGITVERKLIDDNQSQIAFDKSDRLGDSAFRKREKSAVSVFANAFTSATNDDGFSTLGPDGVVLCSASHPRSADDATTQSNAGTSALTKANVGATRVAMMKFTDDRGDLTDCMPDLLLIPPDLEDTVIEITKSALDPTSAQNAVNPQNGRFRYLVWHYLADTNNWFMIDSARMRKALIWYNRIPLEFGVDGDFDTFMTKWRAYMRYSYGWNDWSWIYGHAVA